MKVHWTTAEEFWKYLMGSARPGDELAIGAEMLVLLKGDRRHCIGLYCVRIKEALEDWKIPCTFPTGLTGQMEFHIDPTAAEILIAAYPQSFADV